MKLGAREFLRFFYWRLRRNRADAVHMVGVLPGFLWNAICLVGRVRLARPHRQAVAIALMEHMGDIVVAEPIARMARQRFPDARIFWITRKAYASLPESYPDVDHVITVRCLTEWLLLQRLKLFDVVWDLHADGRMCSRCSIPQIKTDLLSDQENYFDHGTLLEIQCDSAGLPRLDEGPAITPPQTAIAKVDALGLPPHFIAIHCISSDPGKDWPEDKWRQLIARILADWPFEIIELGMRPLVIQHDSARERAVCGMLTVLETAEVIRRAELFIGIDSGPAHLANAVATPGVILLGVYRRFRTYMPYNGGYAKGTNATIVRMDGPVADLSVDAVFAGAANRLLLHEGRSGRSGAPPRHRPPSAGSGLGVENTVRG